jgi:hypothetical protein
VRLRASQRRSYSMFGGEGVELQRGKRMGKPKEGSGRTR